MFKCDRCPKGNAGLGVTQYKVTLVQRKVRYINQIRYDKQIMKEGKPAIVSSFKTVGDKIGYEVVEEKAYCKEHIPKNIKVKTLDKIVERKNIVAIKRAFRGEN